jgi:allophanate hydrolase subunit 1
MNRYSPQPRSLMTPMPDGSAVLLHLDTHAYFSLNSTGRAVWDRLAQHQGATVDEIVSTLTARFLVDEDTARADVTELLEALQQQALVNVSSS